MRSRVKCHVYKLKTDAYIKQHHIYFKELQYPKIPVSFELKSNMMVLIVRGYNITGKQSYNEG